MRIKITLEISGNEFLDLLRRVPKKIARYLLNASVAVHSGVSNLEESEIIWKSASQLIESKKR